MSKVMKQIPFGKLMDWALTEYEQSGSLFGVNKFFRKSDGKHLDIFGEKLELPFGPAAGPHTQVAQNIIAGYAAGARFFELKTVQVLDGEDLPVSKPCIAAPDECYNVEWSTELYVPEAMDEYIKAWYAIKLLSRELGLGDCNGFVFNMSVGYDLDGIKSKKIDDFIEGLKYAANTKQWQICRQWALANISRLKQVDKAYLFGISPEICRSITLSTLHGCPPEEIERIASYLLTEKKLHTFVKCNPTLLGYEYARNTLNSLGYDYIAFDDHHFKADLQFGDAVPMLGRLQELADSLSLSFGVKLTNTFPVQITQGELPGEEMYMSGRALFPLTIEVVNRLSREFDGKLRVGFSGGADARNIEKLVDAGIWPVTVATTLLKPGGYQRLHQIADILDTHENKQKQQSDTYPHENKKQANNDNNSAFCILHSALNPAPFNGVDREKLQALVDEASSDHMYRKPAGMAPERKMKAQVPLLNCFAAPCRDGCPISQDVPAYLRLMGEGKHTEALRVITERNPLPFITGTLCSQFCADKCTREFYEGAVCIRDVKLEAATQAHKDLLKEIKNTPKSGGKIAIIGGGPAGLSAAYFLARAGRPVTIFEKKKSLGGIVRHVIPEFRISEEVIDNDIELVTALGVDIRLNHEIRGQGLGSKGQCPGASDQGIEAGDQAPEIGDQGAKVISLDDLRAEGFETFIFATGAWMPGSFELTESEGGVVLDALEFLGRLKKEPGSIQLGENIAVIGGGNTAMDTARAAKRISGVKKVSLVYRRTKRYMPADAEELELALEDGVEFRELLAPISLKNGVLTCELMELGAPDASGRRSPITTGETATVPADAVIYAVGNHVDTNSFAGFGIKTDKKGRAVVAEDTLETGLPGVYIIGDAKRGPATVVEAIADAIQCAKAITEVETERYAELNVNEDTQSASSKKGIVYHDSQLQSNCASTQSLCEAQRCLECATLCQCCVDVCPNRANITVMAEGHPQIIHVDYMCNECGNCETFCPYSSAPYKDKFTLFANIDDFRNSENPGFVPPKDGLVRVRIDSKIANHINGQWLPEGIWPLIQAVMEMDYVLGE